MLTLFKPIALGRWAVLNTKNTQVATVTQTEHGECTVKRGPRSKPHAPSIDRFVFEHTMLRVRNQLKGYRHIQRAIDRELYL